MKDKANKTVTANDKPLQFPTGNQETIIAVLHEMKRRGIVGRIGGCWRKKRNTTPQEDTELLVFQRGFEMGQAAGN